jgi:SPP1 gp7 family putative phage head morphogenesis protein
MNLTQKMNYKILTKARRKKISPRKQYMVMQREASNYEKRLASDLLSTFSNIYKSISKEYADIGRYPERDHIDEKINQVLLKFYRNIITEFYKRTKDQAGTKDDTISNLVKRYINTIGARNIKEISRTTRLNIRKIIDTSIQDGLSINDIAKNIREESGGAINKVRSFTIARTETHSAMNYGNIEAAKEIAPAKAKKQWIAALDDRTREWHKNMNGVTVGIDEKFNVPYKGINYSMERPGDPAGGPANVINCRCALIFIFDDETVE